MYYNFDLIGRKIAAILGEVVTIIDQNGFVWHYGGNDIPICSWIRKHFSKQCRQCLRKNWSMFSNDSQAQYHVCYAGVGQLVIPINNLFNDNRFLITTCKGVIRENIDNFSSTLTSDSKRDLINALESSPRFNREKADIVRGFLERVVTVCRQEMFQIMNYKHVPTKVQELITNIDDIHDIKNFSEAIVNLLLDLERVEFPGIGYINDEGLLEITNFIGSKGKLPQVLISGEGIGGNVIMTKKPLHIENIWTDYRTLNGLKLNLDPSLTSLYTLPLLLGDEILGVLYFGSKKKLSSNEFATSLFYQIGNLVAMGIKMIKTRFNQASKAHMVIPPMPENLESNLETWFKYFGRRLIEQYNFLFIKLDQVSNDKDGSVLLEGKSFDSDQLFKDVNKLLVQLETDSMFNYKANGLYIHMHTFDFLKDKLRISFGTTSYLPSKHVENSKLLIEYIFLRLADNLNQNQCKNFYQGWQQLLEVLIPIELKRIQKIVELGSKFIRFMEYELSLLEELEAIATTYGVRNLKIHKHQMMVNETEGLAILSMFQGFKKYEHVLVSRGHELNKIEQVFVILNEYFECTGDWNLAKKKLKFKLIDKFLLDGFSGFLVMYNQKFLKMDMDGILTSLTKRELDILCFVGKGYTNKEISEQLYISEKTVKGYLTTIFQKLNIHDRTKLAVLAIKHGIASID